MATRISQRELRNDNAEIVRRVAAGESFVVTRRGVPIADLLPHSDEPARPRFVSAAAVSATMEGLPGWDLDAWQREQETLDEAVTDVPRDPWS